MESGRSDGVTRLSIFPRHNQLDQRSSAHRWKRERQGGSVGGTSEPVKRIEPKRQSTCYWCVILDFYWKSMNIIWGIVWFFFPLISPSALFSTSLCEILFSHGPLVHDQSIRNVSACLSLLCDGSLRFRQNHQSKNLITSQHSEPRPGADANYCLLLDLSKKKKKGKKKPVRFTSTHLLPACVNVLKRWVLTSWNLSF